VRLVASRGPSISRARAFPSLITVVIPARNEERRLPSQLRALAGQDYSGAWEVVVADNGSADQTAGVARAWSDRLPDLRVVDASERKGINHARNVAASAARGDLLVFCDADDMATPGWLAAMAEAARGADLVGGFLDREALNEPSAVAWRGSYPTNHLPVSLGFLPYAEGASLGVRAAVFSELGRWNEDYDVSCCCDDVEFCWRAQLAGYRLCFAPRAVMMYRYRASLPAFARQAYRYGFGEAQLYRDFRDRGLVRPSQLRRLKEWVGLLVRVPELLRSRESRGVWIRRAAQRAGRLRGSIRHRVVFL
jgi:glycosyltransferase involved in cell wall biosynthesis